MPIAAYIPPPDPPTPAPEPAAKPASRLIPNDAQSLRRRIYSYIMEQGDLGATCEQVEMALNLSHQTASARITELRTHRTYGGRITYLMNGGKQVRRATLSGRSANVYVAIPPLSLAP